MDRNLIALFVAAVVALAARSPAAAADLKVVVTIKPIHALVSRVMAGAGTPTLLVQGAASPHTYALKPSDARALNEADLVFRVSEAVEPFTIRVVKTLPKSAAVVTLADAPGLTLYERRRSGTFEAHGHTPRKSGHGHDHGHDHDHDDETASGVDGHVWLDPDNARKMTAAIAAALSARAPASAATFAANAKALDEELAALTTEIARELAPVAGRPFVVFHDAYQYFERRFALAAAGSITLSPEVQPSAKRLTAIRRKIGTLDAACVFAEPQFQPKLVAAVTEGTRARPGTLDPEGANVAAGPGAYAEIMRNLARDLKACLAVSG